MKCPFIQGSCIGRECPGWSLGKCFLEIFLQKMDNISLKLDTLCNLTSITATAHLPQKKPDPATPSKAKITRIDPEGKTPGRHENLWDGSDTDERTPTETCGPKMSVEEPVRGNHTTTTREREPVAPQEEVFADFPLKVSDFSFLGDVMEELPRSRGGAPVRIEITELPMESSPAEELAAGPDDELAINERLLLTSGPATGSGVGAVPYDNISPEFYEDLVPAPQPLVDEAIVKDLTADETAGASAASGSANDEMPPADPTGESLSVEQVIKDIEDTTGDKTHGITHDIIPDTTDDIARASAQAREVAEGIQAIQVIDAETVASMEQVPVPEHVPPQVPPQLPSIEQVAVTRTPEEDSKDSAEAPAIHVIHEIDAQPVRAEEPAPVAAQPVVVQPVVAKEEPVPAQPREETAPMPEARAEPVPTPVAQAPLHPVMQQPVEKIPVEKIIEQSRLVAEPKPIIEAPKPAAVEEPPAPIQAAKEPTPGITPDAHEVPRAAASSTSTDTFTGPTQESARAAGAIEVSVEEMPGEGPDASASDPASWQPIDVIEARGGAVLGIDFGSALSKVALKPDSGSPATAIPLGLTAYDILHKAGLVSRFESENEYVEDSLIYFDHNEFVFCGALAKKLSMEGSETGEGRPAIQNLKSFLVRGGPNLQLHSDFFPASESMDLQSVLAVYLAYLVRLTRHYLSKRATKIPTDLDSTLRAFAIPTWIEERYKEDVKRLFRGAAAYAFCLERWLQDDLVKGVRLADLKAALDEARQYRMKLEDNLVGSIMTESVAAGNSRLIGLEHEKARPLTLLIVNVGAGFTDFALFSLNNQENRGAQPTAQVAYKGGVGTGLSVWDNALKTLLFNKVKDVPATRRKTNEFRIFKSRLELLARDIKEELLAGNEALAVDVSPVLPEPVMIERAELESSLPVKAALFGIRDGLRTYIKEAIKAVGMHRFDPAHTEILITGGGAYMPNVVDCVREAVATLGPAYPAKVRTDYVSALYASIPSIAALYPLLSVSLGVTEDELPDEQLAVPTAPAAPSQNTKGPQQPKVAVNSAGTAPRGINKLKLA